MKIPRPHFDNFADTLRRAGWIFLTVLFIFTGLGVGVYAFWQSTHPSPTTQDQTTQPNVSTTCNFSGAESAPTLPTPQIYKTTDKTKELQEVDLATGAGPAAKSGDCVKAKYYGTIAATGEKFDEDYTQPLALQFPLGQGYVIPGWDQGLQGMRVGGERRLVIPSSLAYGSDGVCKVRGQNPCKDYSIPPNTDLVFVVKLLGIK